MVARQRIVPVRRDYNRWVADQTLEDYALRFTAKSARRFSSQRIAQTAIGAISFLALEAIGGAITLSYGSTNAMAAIAVACVIMLAVSLPVSRYAIRYGVDIDLLTRGASFGYIGSTVSSLIYAAFTFLLFAIEASIMSGALELVLGIPLWIGYIISAVAVIPLVTYGVRAISHFQMVTQPFWIVLNIAPFIVIALTDWQKVDLWRTFAGLQAENLGVGSGAPFVLAQFGAASAVILALTAQIGEQVDFLRFLPPEGQSKLRHRIAVFLAGPGWVVLGGPKLLAGSFLAVLALSGGVPADKAADPAEMYLAAFGYMIPWPQGVLLLTVAFVVVSQLKINVMNAYAGSLAWSNFFSRLTHSHPGRVVWLVFNVAIALLLMELGIYRLLEQTLGVFSLIAMAWLCAVSADLSINKPLGLSPPGIEFKRAYLYDINPVGLGTLVISAGLSMLAHFGIFGGTAEALAPFIALVSAFTVSPLIAWLTKGRFYLARKPRKSWRLKPSLTCSICEHPFEPEDMAWCPAYAAPICSLCCSLDSRCHDLCKPKAKAQAQLAGAARRVLPERAVVALGTRLGRYGLAVAFSLAVLAGILAAVGYQSAGPPEVAFAVRRVLATVFFLLAVMSAVVCWFYVLAHDSRAVAEEESLRQNALLLKEIAAHRKTDAALQEAMEAAQAANRAKSRYVVSLSHELRTPLNVVLGYAQLLERDATVPPKRQPAIHAIRRNADHLSGLIDGLLDISRIEAGRLQVHSNEISIIDFLDQIVDMMQPQARAKGLIFTHKRPDNMPGFMRTDEKRLRQILVNLLSNAIKFTERGHVSFDVSYRNQIAVFTVADSGRGIKESDLARVFEPFQRGDAEELAVPGLGLGLTITRLLAETLGGEISVESTHGEGSTFKVRMMLSAVMHPAPPPSPATITGYEGARRTVMVVDDNEYHRNLVREHLAPLGFEIVEAASGPQCLEKRKAAKPDLFLIDILMPSMSGWQLLSRLREAGETAPIIMLSANIGGYPATDGFDGHNDTLAKPFDLRQLLTKIERLLGLRWISEEPAGPPEQAASEAGLLRSPGDSHLRELLRLGEIGYIRGIEAKLDEIGADGGNRAFVGEVRRFVRNFDMAGYDRFLRGLEARNEEERQ